MQAATPILRDQLTALQDAGRQMLAAARAGSWDRAAEYQFRCHALAEAVFANTLSAADAAAVAGAVNTVLGLQGEVMTLCRESRDTHLRELDSLNQGRQAVNEYSANSG